MMFLHDNTVRSMLAFAAFAIAFVFSIATQSLTPIVFLCLSMAFVFMLKRLDIWFLTIFAFRFSSMRLPFFPHTLTISELAMITIIPMLFIHKLVAQNNIKFNLQKISALAFGSVALVTMIARREFGAKGMGSEIWGGAAYVYMFAAILVLIWIDTVPIKPSSWRRCLILMSTLALVPVLANLVFAFSGGRIYQQFSFVMIHHFTQSQMSAIGTGTGFGRLLTWNGLYLMLLPFVAFRQPFSWKHRISTLIIVLFSFALICTSGYRSALITAGLLTMLWAYLRENNARLVRLAAVAACFLAVVIFLVGFAEYLPSGAQRLVSNIPFAKVDPMIRIDSEQTVLWRIEIWERAVNLIPQYLWLGRGITYSINDVPMTWMLSIDNSPAYEETIVKGDFHNAFLSLLICFGIPGLLTFLVFLGASAKRYWKYAVQQKDKWNNPTIHRLYLIIAAWFFSELIVFLTIYGEIKGGATILFIIAAILEGLIACDRLHTADDKITPELS